MSARTGPAGVRLPAPTPVVLAVTGAWTILLALEIAGSGEILHAGHGAHALTWGRLPLFLAAWAVMLAAMMLPAATPALVRFASGARSPRALAAFTAGYALAWLAAGVWAFAAAAALHHAEVRPALVAAGAFALAGAFQLSPLKRRLVAHCAHGPRGRCVGAARLGVAHGALCVGACWALMLAMLATGPHALVAMAAFTVLMAWERAPGHGQRVLVPSGVALLVCAVALAV